MSTNFFSSLSGSFDYISSMSNLLTDYSSIKNGSYGSLMKSYVHKVGNSNALNAFRETGTTVKSFEDTNTEKNGSSTSKSTSASSTVSSDKYSKLKSSWLDDQLNQYNKDAAKTTAADTSIAYDNTI